MALESNKGHGTEIEHNPCRTIGADAQGLAQFAAPTPAPRSTASTPSTHPCPDEERFAQ
ncbi:hypothetical protein [Streptomyces sp. NPDC058108]|uniref:hypothetical protein n=1 Tax=Streptomyces sp. NPDC058108 TaxID=3346344 RepID=UPI0036E719CB